MPTSKRRDSLITQFFNTAASEDSNDREEANETKAEVNDTGGVEANETDEQVDSKGTGDEQKAKDNEEMDIDQVGMSQPAGSGMDTGSVGESVQSPLHSKALFLTGEPCTELASEHDGSNSGAESITDDKEAKLLSGRQSSALRTKSSDSGTDSSSQSSDTSSSEDSAGERFARSKKKTKRDDGLVIRTRRMKKEEENRKMDLQVASDDDTVEAADGVKE
jgi:hypothetical protein